MLSRNTRWDSTAISQNETQCIIAISPTVYSLSLFNAQQQHDACLDYSPSIQPYKYIHRFIHMYVHSETYEIACQTWLKLVQEICQIAVKLQRTIICSRWWNVETRWRWLLSSLTMLLTLLYHYHTVCGFYSMRIYNDGLARVGWRIFFTSLGEIGLVVSAP